MSIKINKAKIIKLLAGVAIMFVAICAFSGFQTNDVHAAKYTKNQKLSVQSFDIICSVVRPSSNGSCGGVHYKKKWGYSGGKHHWLTVFVFRVKIDGHNYYGYGYCGDGKTIHHNCTKDSKFHVETAKVVSVNDCAAKVKIEFDASRGCQDIEDGYITIPSECTATFSGSTTGPGNKKIGCNTDSKKVTFKHKIKRTDKLPYSAKANYKIQRKTNSGSYSNKKDSSATLKKGKSKTVKSNVTIKVGKPAAGKSKSKTVCERLWHNKKVTFSSSDNHIGSAPESVTETEKCVKVTRSCGGGCAGFCCDGNCSSSSTLSVNMNQDLLFAGESASTTFNLTIIPNELGSNTETTKSGNTTTVVKTDILADTHKVNAIQFAIPDSYDYDSISNADFGKGDDNDGKLSNVPENAIVSTLVNSVKQRIGNILSSDGYAELGTGVSAASSSTSPTTSSTAPDLIGGRSSVGGKYCVAAIDTTTHHKRVTTTTTTEKTVNGKKKTEKSSSTKMVDTYDPSLGVVSNIDCRPIAKKPYFQIENASVYGAGSISNYGTTTKSVRATIRGGGSTGNFGSWTEYMLVGNNSVKDVTSGAALSNGLLGSNANPLTISNNNNSRLGYSNVSSTGFAEAITDYYSSGNVGSDTIVASDSPAVVSSIDSFGGKQILISNDDVVIDGNIYADGGNFASGTDVTQHVIISTDGNIDIEGDVSNIDAWLVAPNGSINTCYGETPDECPETQLVINGLVTAKNINFERPYGMETPLGNPAAEKVIFSPNAYLWSYQQASKNTSQTSTVFVRELAPRQ